MKLIPVAAACLIASLAAAPVVAGCSEPAELSASAIPDGTTATRDEMVAAQKAVKAYDTAVREYTQCLEQQGDSGGIKQSNASENAVAKDEQLTGRFNAELRAFKAKNRAS